jgi:hypothetical protein
MGESRRTPREDEAGDEFTDEPESVPVDIEAKERELEEAGWEPVERTGKRVWRHPETGHLYPLGPALQRLRSEEGSS